MATMTMLYQSEPLRGALGLIPYVALVWGSIVILVITVGAVELYRAFALSAPTPISSTLHTSQTPHVTAIRPVNGIEPLLYECLASTFAQSYPTSKLTVYFCISSRNDPAFKILECLVADFPEHDARILVESEDTETRALGPNPKIRNMSRAYREAKGDMVWIVDCNVWLSPSVCGIMVDRLCGFAAPDAKPERKFKFVHQMPVAVDVSGQTGIDVQERDGLLSSAGAALDELFLSTSHAKFYTAISTVAIAPCICGKSNMFRRSHLDALTPPDRPGRYPGIDFFSDNICEDHLIGDLLWRTPVPPQVLVAAENEGKSPETASTTTSHSTKWSNHAIVISPPCLQPLAHVPLRAYAARRARWLRVRKFTVPAATLVEPGTESLLASASLALGLTGVAQVREALGLHNSWVDFAKIFLATMVAWCALDYAIWRLLQGWRGDQAREAEPIFGGKSQRKGFFRWLAAWAGREMLAFPVWAWAVFGGTTVVWRGRRFWVGVDMKVRAIDAVEKKNA